MDTKGKTKKMSLRSAVLASGLILCIGSIMFFEIVTGASLLDRPQHGEVPRDHLGLKSQMKRPQPGLDPMATPPPPPPPPPPPAAGPVGGEAPFGPAPEYQAIFRRELSSKDTGVEKWKSGKWNACMNFNPKNLTGCGNACSVEIECKYFYLGDDGRCCLKSAYDRSAPLRKGVGGDFYELITRGPLPPPPLPSASVQLATMEGRSPRIAVCIAGGIRSFSREAVRQGLQKLKEQLPDFDTFCCLRLETSMLHTDDDLEEYRRTLEILNPIGAVLFERIPVENNNLLSQVTMIEHAVEMATDHQKYDFYIRMRPDFVVVDAKLPPFAEWDTNTIYTTRKLDARASDQVFMFSEQLRERWWSKIVSAKKKGKGLWSPKSKLVSPEYVIFTDKFVAQDTPVQNGPCFYGGLLRQTSYEVLYWDRRPKPSKYQVPRDKPSYNVTRGKVKSFDKIRDVTCGVVPRCKFVTTLSTSAGLSQNAGVQVTLWMSLIYSIF
jgi:hypothetical protein